MKNGSCFPFVCKVFVTWDQGKTLKCCYDEFVVCAGLLDVCKFVKFYQERTNDVINCIIFTLIKDILGFFSCKLSMIYLFSQRSKSKCFNNVRTTLVIFVLIYLCFVGVYLECSPLQNAQFYITYTNQDEWLPLLGQHKYMYPYLNVNQITQYSTLYTKKDFRKDVTAKTFESCVYVRILYHHEVRK